MRFSCEMYTRVKLLVYLYRFSLEPNKQGKGSVILLALSSDINYRHRNLHGPFIKNQFKIKIALLLCYQLGEKFGFSQFCYDGQRLAGIWGETFLPQWGCTTFLWWIILKRTQLQTKQNKSNSLQIKARKIAPVCDTAALLYYCT